MASTRPGGAPLILVIDDVEDNRTVYSELFELMGFRVLTAGDGTEGLATARDGKPDIVLLDLGLPNIDGWEVARRLRADPETKEISIVALTGERTEEARARAFTAGVDAYLTKPCRPCDVVEEIRRRLAIVAERKLA
jgi:CheY-like chemotaxis protein